MNIPHLLAAATLFAVLAQPAQARMLDPAIPHDAVEITKRIQCPAPDEETVVYAFSGNIYSRIRGERDRLLLRALGMNIRRCTEIVDPVRGTGYRLTSRELLLYLDPVTGEVVRQWKNPWTGETVEVMHVANDPVNSRPFLPFDANGVPFTLDSLRLQGDWAFWQNEIPQWYPNPLSGEYQEYVGAAYHAMEIFNFTMRKDTLLDTSIPTTYPAISWVRLSRWLPWMKMEDRDGTIVFNAMGSKLDNGIAGLPQILQDEIAANYPQYVTAPPGDDTRPNETAWTMFKARMDALRKAAGESR